MRGLCHLRAPTVFVLGGARLLTGCSHADELEELNRRRIAPIQQNTPEPSKEADPPAPPAPPCSVKIMEPTASSMIAAAQDFDGAQADVQVALVVAVANCTALTLRYGLCTGSSSGPVAPATWQGDIPNADGTQTARLTLPNNAGALLPCVQSDKLDAVAIERVCTDNEVACGPEKACRTDTKTNPLFCGGQCLTCGAAANGRPACVDGACTTDCDDGYRLVETHCRQRQSCKGQQILCNGKDCCAEDRIAEQAGQELRFVRGYDASQNSTSLAYFQSQSSGTVVVQPFYLDRYEVTVGRFRLFVEGFEDWLHASNPKSTYGIHPSNLSSGWQDAWTFERLTLLDGSNVSLIPQSRAEVVARLTGSQCDPKHLTWTSERGPNEALPINCLDFFLAYMFCMWDSDSTSGRLPTEAEWHAAASGGGQQRAYPWSSPDYGSLEIEGHAEYDQGERAPYPVGLHGSGVGRWGSHDLGGNVMEWVRDTSPARSAGSSFYVDDPDDPIQLKNDSDVLEDRVARGGSFKRTGCVQCTAAAELRSIARRLLRPHEAYNDVGFRCARNYR